MKKDGLRIIAVLFFVIFSYNLALAHCDTMEGPVILDAKKSIETKNVNYVLKWVKSENEKEITQAFDEMMKVRNLNQDARDLSEKYFFETLVRVHRAGEGVAYTGVKPYGTPIDEKIQAADKSIELGNLSPLKNFVPAKKTKELNKLFDKVMSLKNFDVNNVKAGREYVEAYVQFFHFAEGEAEQNNHGRSEHKCK